MKIEEYLSDPCGASSLPYWKTVSMSIPEGITIIRDDRLSGKECNGKDEPYFRMMHNLQVIKDSPLPKGYGIVNAGIDDFSAQINSCYTEEHISPEELQAYRSHPVYMPDLWIAVADLKNRKTIATGIAEFDSNIGEGILEWIQVSPEYRKKGLGSFIVCELLKRLRNRAGFVTVSGRMNNESNPYALYASCGFGNPVIWHVIKD